MGKTAQSIVREIVDFILNSKDCEGKYFNNYFIGTTHDPEKMLFIYHGVDKKSGCWIYKKATSAGQALEVMRLLTNASMQSENQPLDDKNIFVYCYLITNNTKP